MEFNILGFLQPVSTFFFIPKGKPHDIEESAILEGYRCANEKCTGFLLRDPGMLSKTYVVCVQKHLSIPPILICLLLQKEKALFARNACFLGARKRLEI